MAMPHAPVPLACRLEGLAAAERGRRAELHRGLRAALQESRELPDGWAFRLPATTQAILEAAEWIALERRCCPFLDFALASEVDGGVWLRVTGGAGVKAFVAAAMGAAAAP